MAYKPKVVPKLLVGVVTPVAVHTVHVSIQASPTMHLMSDDERLAVNDAYLMDRLYRVNGELN
jgi:hypothetical protein